MKRYKPLLKLQNDKSFIENILLKLSRVCHDIVIVSGHNHDKLKVHLDDSNINAKYNVVFNEDYRTGMFTSLRTGLISAQADWYLYHFVDQPNLPEKFYSAFVNQISSECNWIQPFNEKGKGHPILFDSFIRDIILDSNKNNNLRDINKDDRIKKKYWEYYSHLIFQDIDTDEDYLNIG